jgi:hypothetical protein
MYVCVLSTIFTPLCFLLIYDKPDFSPTMGEEEKKNKGALSFGE